MPPRPRRHRFHPATAAALGLALAWALALAVAGPLAMDEARASEPRIFEFGGRDRSYAIHLPASAAGRTAVPVVFVLHGAGSSGADALRLYGWEKKAEMEGFIAVAPDATPADPAAPAGFLHDQRIWNDGSGRGGPAVTGSDDVGLIRGLIEALAQRYPIDRKRLYATGFSNGASMVQRLGIELAGTLAAIAPVAGPLWTIDMAPAQAVPVFFLAGSQDPFNPLEGGAVRLPWGEVEERPPFKDVPAQWARLDGCVGGPRPLETRERVTATIWPSCRDRAEVVFYVVDGLGHHWPGSKRSKLPESQAGRPSDAVSATDLIWAFFRRHHLP